MRVSHPWAGSPDRGRVAHTRGGVGNTAAASSSSSSAYSSHCTPCKAPGCAGEASAQRPTSGCSRHGSSPDTSSSSPGSAAAGNAPWDSPPHHADCARPRRPSCADASGDQRPAPGIPCPARRSRGSCSAPASSGMHPWNRRTPRTPHTPGAHTAQSAQASPRGVRSCEAPPPPQGESPYRSHTPEAAQGWPRSCAQGAEAQATQTHPPLAQTPGTSSCRPLP